jgi:hypothetical protein
MRLRRDRTRDRGAAVEGAVAIGTAPRRSRVVVCGEVVRIRTKPTVGLPVYFVTISDGTGNAVALLTGRFKPPPLGATVVVEGVGCDSPEGLRFMNPAFSRRSGSSSDGA